MNTRARNPARTGRSVLGVLFALFLLAQSLAIGVQATGSPVVWFGVLEAVAVLAVLGSAATFWWWRVSRTPLQYVTDRRSRGEAAWLATSARETRDAIERMTRGEAGRLPPVFAIESCGEDVRIVSPPSSEPIISIPRSSIRAVATGVTHGVGGPSECLVFTIETTAGLSRLPVVLQRDGGIGLLTQVGETLSRSKDDITLMVDGNSTRPV